MSRPFAELLGPPGGVGLPTQGTLDLPFRPSIARCVVEARPTPYQALSSRASNADRPQYPPPAFTGGRALDPLRGDRVANDGAHEGARTEQRSARRKRTCLEVTEMICDRTQRVYRAVVDVIMTAVAFLTDPIFGAPGHRRLEGVLGPARGNQSG